MDPALPWLNSFIYALIGQKLSCVGAMVANTPCED